MTGEDGTQGPSPRKVYYLLPDCKVVEEGDKAASTAVKFCFDGDGSKGLGWRPIHDLEGYRKPQAAGPAPRPRNDPGDQPRFPSKKP